MHVFLKPGELLSGRIQGEFYQRMWSMAQAASFEPADTAASPTEAAQTHRQPALETTP
ncbi:hypothetical protein D3C77_736600 [compost metagenome]